MTQSHLTTTSPEGVATPQNDPQLAAEMSALLEHSTGKLADVWREYKIDPTGRTYTSSVKRGTRYGMLGIIELLLAKRTTQGPSFANIARNNISTLVNRGEGLLSPAGRAWVSTLQSELARIAESEEAAAEEIREIDAAGQNLSALDEVGAVYVYTYGGYFQHPLANGRTLLKVGMTEKHTARARIAQQERMTSSPEDALVLRVYQPGDSGHSFRQMEANFHRILKAAEHTNDRSHRGGREWFPTTLELLDTIADACGYAVFTQ